MYCAHWTIQGLEDEFDGTNRQNLRHFIYQDLKGAGKQTDSSTEDDDGLNDSENILEDRGVEYYYLPKYDGPSPPLSEAERRVLPRIPTCAIFHKMTRGRGVPHSFVGTSDLDTVAN